MKALQVIKGKIIDREAFGPLRNRWELKDEKVVFTNGCFDILHQGHVDYLSKASDLGTKLVVGVNTEDSVRRLGKDVNRPIQDQYSRALLLAALHFVDAVIFFDEDTPLELIKIVNPNTLVKGSDYKIHQIVGYEFVKEIGGEVLTIDFLDGYSTTRIIEKAQK